jgi:hypothetical protein
VPVHSARPLSTGSAAHAPGEYVLVSAPEYNRRYAHPFAWTWTSDKMREWLGERAAEFLA